MPAKESAALERLLEEAAERGASDLYLIPGEPPIFRVGSELERKDEAPLAAGDVEKLVFTVVESQRAAKIGTETGGVIAHCGVEGVAEGRMCLAKSRGQFTAVIRILASELPSPAAAGIPRALLEAAESPHGLIVLTGSPGSGKTTTALVLLEHLNAKAPLHIVTLEDPVCVRLEPKRAVIQQREVGLDTPSYIAGLKTVMRQDPDVIFVGEVRDLATLQACITTARTGHLVITQLHEASPEAAIEKMLDVQPEDMAKVFRKELAAVLRAVAAQRLLPEANGKGCLAAYGVLVVDDEMRRAIAEGKDIFDRAAPLPGGSQTLAEDIERLRAEGKITDEIAARLS